MNHSAIEIEALLDAATDAVASKNWDVVKALSERALETDPENPEAAGLKALAARHERRTTAIATADAERRFLTVAFIDMVASTEVSSRLDPEEYREVLQLYQAEVQTAMNAYGGYVAKLLGDGAIVYFGYPNALEDAPRRACLAGLEITRRLDEVAPVFERRFGTRVRCRVGIHSDLTVIGSLGDGSARETRDVVGDLPNIAARLEGLAGPGEVLVSDSTYRLVEGYFDAEARGPQSIRGLESAIDAHRIVAATEARARLDVHPAAGRTPFVGRSDELSLLVDAWYRATGGRTARISVRGEAGIGKSRLLERFRERIVAEGGTWLEGGCTEYRSGSAFHAFSDALTRVLRRSGVGSLDTQRIADLLGVTAKDAAFIVMQLAGTDSIADADLTPTQIRRGIIAAIRSWIGAAAVTSPTVLVVEDLHWADPSSLAVIDELTESPDLGPVLILTTARPIFQPGDSPTGLVLSLGRLSTADTAAMVEGMTIGGPLDDRARQFAVTRTDGVPLFIEEMVLDLRSADTVPEGAQIPSSLQDLLTTRLDRLGEAKRTAQVASVLGRTFSMRAVAAMAPDLTERLESDLTMLTASDLAFRSALLGSDTITFKHSLIRDAAYESLLRTQRRELHNRAAQALRTEFPEMTTRSPELIAHHLTEAGRVGPALSAWVEAGRVAVARSDHEEAIGHYQTALGLLDRIDDHDQAEDTELTIQVQLGSPLTAARGYASPDVEGAYARAAELAEKRDDPRQTFRTARGLAQVYLLRGDVVRARQLLEVELRRAMALGDRDLLLEATAWLGTAQFFQGEFRAANHNLSDANIRYDADRDGRHRLDSGIDPWILATSHQAWLLWLTGAPRASREMADELVDHARSLQDPLGLAHALTYASGLHHLRGEGAALGRTAAEAQELAIEHGFPHYTSYGGIYRGQSRADVDASGALDDMAAALELRRSTGAALALPYHLTMIADVHLLDGKPAAALATLAEASAVVAATAEQWWLPEILRIRGAAHAAAGDDAAALRDTDAAVSSAADAGSLSLELRANLQRHRLSGEGVAQIRAVLEQMIDHDDTADLTSARRIAAQGRKGTQ